MKNIFLFCGILTCSIISAQQPFIIPKKSFENKFRYYDSQKSKIKLPDSLRFFLNKGPQARLQFILSNNTKVYSLPQDNMLCLVPDMKQFNMPNTGIPEKYVRDFLKSHPELYKKSPGQIPNAIIPYDIITQRKDKPE